jgi:hypothetical protein
MLSPFAAIEDLSGDFPNGQVERPSAGTLAGHDPIYEDVSLGGSAGNSSGERR